MSDTAAKWAIKIRNESAVVVPHGSGRGRAIKVYEDKAEAVKAAGRFNLERDRHYPDIERALAKVRDRQEELRLLYIHRDRCALASLMGEPLPKWDEPSLRRELDETTR